MKVRDHSYKKTEHKGKEIDCHDEQCPCRYCYNCCASQGDRYICYTNETHGCPDPIPAPHHLFKPSKKLANAMKLILTNTHYCTLKQYVFSCTRCGQQVDINHANFKTKEQ